MSRLTDDHIEELDREGFIIVPDFVRGDDLTRLQAAQRRVLPTWEEVQQKPPQDQSGNSLLVCFPHEEMELYQGAMDAESIDFARKWLKTADIHMRVGCLVARYPGHSTGGTGEDDSNLHIDNGNNSLLPFSDQLREFGQIGFWVHLEDVKLDQAPLRLIAKRHGRDMTQAVPLVCRAGTLCVFTNFSWHSCHCLYTCRRAAIHLGLQFWSCRSLLGGLQALHPPGQRRARVAAFYRRSHRPTAPVVAVPASGTSVLHRTDTGPAGRAVSGLECGRIPVMATRRFDRNTARAVAVDR